MAIIFGQNDAADTIDGTNFRDVIYGGSPGRPFIDTGEDLIKGDDGFDDIYGGDGDDDLRGDDGNDFLNGGVGDDLLTGGDDNDLVDGQSGADEVHGGSGDDIVHADAGESDEADGGSGNDLLVFHAVGFNEDINFDFSDPSAAHVTSDGTTILALDQLVYLGAAANDFVIGGDSDDWLAGNEQNDFLEGGDGDDALYGGHARDTLTGGSGDDDLQGGLGADRFVFGDNDGRDLVLDFKPGVDKLDVSTVDAVHGFGDLDVTDRGSSIEVDYGNGSFILAGVGNVGAIDAGDFIFG